MTRDEILKLEAGRELDAQMAKYVTHCTYLFHETYPPYSTNIAAAWEVVEKMAQIGLRIHIHNIPEWYCKFIDEHGQERSRSGFCDTAPLAICRGARVAVTEE